METVNRFLETVSQRMRANKLLFDPDKMELLLVGGRSPVLDGDIFCSGWSCTPKRSGS